MGFRILIVISFVANVVQNWKSTTNALNVVQRSLMKEYSALNVVLGYVLNQSKKIERQEWIRVIMSWSLWLVHAASR